MNMVHSSWVDTMRVWVKQDEPQPTWARFVEALERLKKFLQFVYRTFEIKILYVDYNR